MTEAILRKKPGVSSLSVLPDGDPGGWWWNAPSKIRFARDSPLEESGFELLVPP
jgi:hypothetical protein